MLRPAPAGNRPPPLSPDAAPAPSGTDTPRLACSVLADGLIQLYPFPLWDPARESVTYYESRNDNTPSRCPHTRSAPGKSLRQPRHIPIPGAGVPAMLLIAVTHGDNVRWGLPGTRRRHDIHGWKIAIPPTLPKKNCGNIVSAPRKVNTCFSFSPHLPVPRLTRGTGSTYRKALTNLHFLNPLSRFFFCRGFCRGGGWRRRPCLRGVRRRPSVRR